MLAYLSDRVRPDILRLQFPTASCCVVQPFRWPTAKLGRALVNRWLFLCASLAAEMANLALQMAVRLVRGGVDDHESSPRGGEALPVWVGHGGATTTPYRQAAMGRVPNGVRVCAEVGTFRLTFFIYPIIYLIPIESSGFVV